MDVLLPGDICVSMDIFVRFINKLSFRIFSCNFIRICIRSGRRVAHKNVPILLVFEL